MRARLGFRSARSVSLFALVVLFPVRDPRKVQDPSSEEPQALILFSPVTLAPFGLMDYVLLPRAPLLKRPPFSSAWYQTTPRVMLTQEDTCLRFFFPLYQEKQHGSFPLNRALTPTDVPIRDRVVRDRATLLPFYFFCYLSLGIFFPPLLLLLKAVPPWFPPMFHLRPSRLSEKGTTRF